ncbi:YceI family protein [Chachezhania sediminis]|uniref:YceI family protein n=1 Tax=Chachezhania sediminis TaxID=2599291 RepID=UPI001E631DF3|nr:YceI family protein [Chachezhania sediminis]
MNTTDRRAFLFGLSALPLAAAMAPRGAEAGLLKFRLLPEASSVAFSFKLAGIRRTGKMPIRTAEIDIDRGDPQYSTVDVTVDAARASTRLPFVAEAMRSFSVLNVDQFPTIHFVSTRVRPGPSGILAGGGEIDGDLTMRGITRPVTFGVKVGPATKGDQMAMQLIGDLSRSAFGASGFSELVGDKIQLDVMATLVPG